jgi:hypothetical protein
MFHFDRDPVDGIASWVSRLGRAAKAWEKVEETGLCA